MLCFLYDTLKLTFELKKTLFNANHNDFSRNTFDKIS